MEAISANYADIEIVAVEKSILIYNFRLDGSI
jgi:hypothetical protein